MCRERIQSGSVAMVAIVGLVVVLIIALGLLTLANQTFLVGKRQPHLTALRALTDAGTQYGYWQYTWQGVSVPFVVNSYALGDGSFAVTVTDNRANVPYTIKVVSIATLGSDRAMTTRVFADPGIGGPKKMLDYGLACNSTLSAVLNSVVAGSGSQTSDLYANGNISLLLGGVKIYGNVYCTGTDSVTAMTGKDYAYLNPITFPTIDPTYYQGIANRTFSGTQTWNNFTFLMPYEVVYVNGAVQLKGQISGTGTIVASGQVTVNGTLSYGDSTCKLAVLTQSGLTISGGSSLVGFYYAHNASNNASCSCSLPLLGSMHLTQGSIAADSFSILSNITVVRDPQFDTTLAQSLHIPGY